VTTLILEWGEQTEAQPKAERRTMTETDFEKALTAALNGQGRNVPREKGGSAVCAVSRDQLREAFKGVYRGEPNGVRQVFYRAMKAAGDSIEVFEVEGVQFVARIEDPL
jgi:hypothetical protein